MSTSLNDGRNEDLNEESSTIFAGVEGGATQSTLVLADSRGQVLGQWKGSALNCLLKGVEATADYICEWIRSIIAVYNVKNPLSTLHLPISGLGMGLAGAEDALINEKMIAYLTKNHSDVSNHFYLTADSIIAISSCFSNGGVVLIAGTGSACRLLKQDGAIHGVGGWGHLLGDGGSGYWIAIRAIRSIFDAEDEMEHTNLDVEPAKAAFLEHFNIKDKLQIFDLLYGERFEKSKIASFCLKLSESQNGDTFSTQIFNDAGASLAQHLCAISRHFDDEMFSNISLLTVGSVFQSWSLLQKGFDTHIRKYSWRKPISKILLFRLDGTAALGAIFLAAKTLPGFSNEQTSKLFKAIQSGIIFDELSY